MNPFKIMTFSRWRIGGIKYFFFVGLGVVVRVVVVVVVTVVVVDDAFVSE